MQNVSSRLQGIVQRAPDFLHDLGTSQCSVCLSIILSRFGILSAVDLTFNSLSLNVAFSLLACITKQNVASLRGGIPWKSQRLSMNC